MNALPIQPLAETADSVTLSRRDFEALTDLVADAADLADVEAVTAKIAAGETRTFPFAVAERLLDGDHPVRVFREYRGLGLRQLASTAGVSPSYLSEIESGEKPGSFECMRRLAAALDVSMDMLARAAGDSVN
jgi:ribosome-binding protein aMBF1 (putative translation factor)